MKQQNILSRLFKLGVGLAIGVTLTLTGCGGGGGAADNGTGGGGTSQTINFGTAPAIAKGGTGVVSATSTSGLAVSFSSLTTGVCTISGSIVTGVSTGTCTIAADQAGNAAYIPATQVTQDITILTPVSAPLAVFAISGINQVTLSWLAVSGATSYNIYWGGAAGITTASTKISGTTSPYTHTGLSAGNTYYYRVSAVNAGGEVLSDEKFSFIYAGGNLASTFVATGSMAVARSHHTATLLNNGNVLITGGIASTSPISQQMGSTYNAVNSAELYNPANGTFSPAGTMTAQRWGHSATLLPSGKVLITGGGSSGILGGAAGTATVVSLTSAELYDPSTGVFTATGNMLVGDSYQSVVLPSGKVLFLGGSTVGKAQLYDPATGQFSYTAGNMVGLTFSVYTATLLPNGKVLVTGWSNPASPANLYDPETGSFTAIGTTGRIANDAELLPNGKVLLLNAGSTELYDYVTNTFTTAGATTFNVQFGARIVLEPLSNGKFYLPSIGMASCIWGQCSADGGSVFDPVSYQTSTFAAFSTPHLKRQMPTSTPLPNGKVLVAGGYEQVVTTSPAPLATAELFQ